MLALDRDIVLTVEMQSHIRMTIQTVCGQPVFQEVSIKVLQCPQNSE